MQKHYRIVLIEDNPADAVLIKKTLTREASCEIITISDGDKAYRYFEDFSNMGSVPDLVVLDLNLPGRDGCEVLDLIRRTPALREIRVAVVSSSPQDVIEQKALKADCYIMKPSDLDEFLAIGKELLKCVRT